MPELNKQEIRSPEMQEVMSEIPGRFLRWGLFLFFGIIMMLAAASWFISYPVVVTAPVTITTQNPPAALITRSGGKIARLFVQNNDNVTAGQPVALIENTASYPDMMQLVTFLDSAGTGKDWKDVVTHSRFPEGLSLGSVQNSYSQFGSAWQQLREYIEQAYIPSKLALLEKQAEIESEYTEQLMYQKRLSEEEMKMSKKSFERDSLMSIEVRHAVSKGELEQSRQEITQKQMSYSSLIASIKSNESSAVQMKETRLDLKVQYEKDMHQFSLSLSESLQLLQVAIKEWKDNYLVGSPVAGRVTFTSYWNENQVVKAGEALATVIPTDVSRIIVRAKVPVAGLGRVKPGQEVNIKLSGFPYLEYGVIKGTVNSISLVPVDDVYIAGIELTNGMKSTYNRDISFIQEMDGTADIVTEKNRLIFKFVKTKAVKEE